MNNKVKLIKRKLLHRIFPLFFRYRLSKYAQVVFKFYGVLVPLKRPIFVIGIHRSGTSIFTRFLGLSNEIVNWSEANEMWDPIGYPWENDRISRPFWSIDPKAYTDSVLNSVDKSYFKSIPGICSMYTSLNKKMQGQVRFLNKSPMNTLKIDFIRSLFPDAVFISIVRDSRAVNKINARKVGS